MTHFTARIVVERVDDEVPGSTARGIPSTPRKVREVLGLVVSADTEEIAGAKVQRLLDAHYPNPFAERTPRGEK